MKKVFYLITTILFVMFILLSKPFLECNEIDCNIYKSIMKVVSLSSMILLFINLSKVKKKIVFDITVIIITIIVSTFIYSGHSKDYKTNVNLLFKNISSNSKISTSSVVTKEVETVDSELSDGILRISYIDVGQGDSIFIEFPDNTTMLIDAGEKNQKNKVISYIKNLGYKKIDYVVGTHPHTDHIGALSSVIKEFDIEKIYMPKKDSNSKTFIELLNTIKNKGLKINTAKAGVVIKDSDDLKVKIIAPVKEYNNANSSSAVVKITYKNKKFLFMGDAEVDSEKDIIENVECDVIKIGHHGSDTSSSQDFVNKTKANYVIISVGANNIYNHPYENIIKRWEKVGAEIFRTDKLGDIVLEIDGQKIKFVSNFINEKNNLNNIELISLNAVCGKEGSIKIKGDANTKYSIDVYIASGKSKAKDLIDKISDDNGYVSWNWKISSNTKKGKYKIVVKSKTSEKEIEYEIK